jgi:hypothetical protein
MILDFWSNSDQNSKIIRKPTGTTNAMSARAKSPPAATRAERSEGSDPGLPPSASEWGERGSESGG